MKTRFIAEKYNFKQYDLERFIREHKEFNTNGLLEMNVPDSEVEKLVNAYKEELAQEEQKRAAEEKEQAERARREQERQQAIANMLVTSGFNFDGYSIKKYSGYISGDDAIQINRDELFSKSGQLLTDSLVMIRVQAMKELKEAAYDLGCNAVIGVDFDYITFEPESIGAGGTHYYNPYVVCVTANGNAVVIEKN